MTLEQSLTLVTEHPRPSLLAVALEGVGAVPVPATRQADALGAVGAEPADVAGADVGRGAVAVDAAGVADGRGAVGVLVGPAGQADHRAVARADVVLVALFHRNSLNYKMLVPDKKKLQLMELSLKW